MMELGTFRVTRVDCGHDWRYAGYSGCHRDDWERYPHYSIWLADYHELNQKRAFARLRKAIKAYRHSSPWWGVDYGHSETGEHWILHQETLFHFVDCFLFEAPLDLLLEEAKVACHNRVREQDRRSAQQREEYARGAAQEEEIWRIWSMGYGLGYRSSRYNDVDEALRLFKLNSDATQADVKRQYHYLAKQHHPDTGGDAEQFKRVHTAYQKLMFWTADRTA